MGRNVLEPLALFLSPFAVYALYLALRARYPLEVEHWTRGRVSIMTLIGLAAAVLGLVAINAFAPRGRGVYVPAHVENGVLVPGRIRMTALPGLADGKLKDLTPLQQGPLARALEALNGGGEETRLVGGAVRDLALGEPAVDFDLTTTATTDEVIRRAREAGFKVALTGVAHGTVTVIVDGRPIETTTLREDVETDGRWAKVAFGRDFAADARRRDFTINALSLERRRDGPRLCRRARGSCAPDGCASSAMRKRGFARIICASCGSSASRPDTPRTGSTATGLSAAIRARGGLARLSRERVRAELMKLLAAPRASEVVQTMGESGFLEPILGGVGYTRRLSRLIAIEAERGAGRRRPPAAGGARRRDPGRRGTAARAAASRQRRSRPAEIRGRGPDRPARDRSAAIVPWPQNPPVQRRARGGARRAHAR